MRRRLAVLRALGLGDFLTGLPALRALRAAFPEREHELVLVAPAGLGPLAALAGAVDRVASDPPERAETAVNLHGRGPQSHRRLLAAEPRRLLAFEHAEVPESRGMPTWYADEHEVKRWCRLLTECGIPADPRDLKLDVEPVGEPGATVIHPGAASGSRRWPAERFAAVARAERAAGRDVLLTGSPGEVQLARTVAEQAGLPDAAVRAGRTSLVEMAGLVAAAGRLVCGDTGVAHLATAVGTPSVVLFGPVPPHEWGPPADDGRHRALWTGLRGDPHDDDVHPGLLSIGVSDVLDELSRLDEAA